jgi:hypothetical protein
VDGDVAGMDFAWASHLGFIMPQKSGESNGFKVLNLSDLEKYVTVLCSEIEWV